MDRALEWANVLAVPAGKKRFQAIRARLRDYLHETADTPSASKKFLSEKLILSVGKSGDPSKLPDELKQMLGGPEAQQGFANELNSAYVVLTGKAPQKETGAVFDAALDNMEQEGVPADKVGYLRKLGPTALVAAMGPGFAFTSMKVAQKSPEMKGLLGRLKDEAFGAGLEPRAAVPAAASAAEVAAPAAESLAPAAGGAIAAVAKGGLRGRIMGVLGRGAIPAIFGAIDLYTIGHAITDPMAERKSAADMAKTGIIPDVLGGNYIPAHGAKGEPISSGQFLQMIQERQDQLKAARFNAATQEGDLTRKIMSYLSGGPDQEQRAVQRMQLGSARPAQAQQPPVDQVMKQFDSFLRQATAGEVVGGE